MRPLRCRELLLPLLVACGSSSGGGFADDAGAGVDAAAGDAGTVEGGGADASKPPSDAAPGAKVRVRLMAANISSGTQQHYEAPGVRIFQGLKPDLAMVQEFNYASDLRALVDAAFGAEFSFYVEPRTTGIPNAIVSRFPIVDSGAWVDSSVPDRSFAWARVDVPGPVDLVAVSVHLLTTGGNQRNTEAKQLLGYLQANVPAGSFVVVGGDFNTDSTAEAALGTLSPVLAVSGPFPADASGNGNTSINRNYPHDLLLVSPGLQAFGAPVTLGASSFAAGLVFDSRVYTPLAEVAPVLAGDSSVSGMQHMPVVRDFLVPGD